MTNKKLTHPFKRVLLKISGEMLMEGQSFGLNAAACHSLAEAIKGFQNKGFEIGIVVGGGNIFRGIDLNAKVMQRSPADQMGMLATLINGIALQQAIQSVGCAARVMTALECPRVAETYTWRQALDYMEAGEVVIFVGGTGNPYFTTDTAAALRASEINANIFLKATKVDGIYNKDPKKHADALKYTTISYSQMLTENLGVMDATAVALCRSNKIPILVFNMRLLNEGKICEVLEKPQIGSLVSGD